MGVASDSVCGSELRVTHGTCMAAPTCSILGVATTPRREQDSDEEEEEFIVQQDHSTRICLHALRRDSSSNGVRELPVFPETRAGLASHPDLSMEADDMNKVVHKNSDASSSSIPKEGNCAAFAWRKLLRNSLSLDNDMPLSARTDGGVPILNRMLGPLTSRVHRVRTSGAVTSRVGYRQGHQLKTSYSGFFDRMLDGVLFPAPAPSYTLSSLEDELVILRRADGELVPCLFVPCSFSRFVVIYFHANAEDLGNCRDFCVSMSKVFQVHVLAVEYPGYGICLGTTDEVGIRANVDAAMGFVTESLEWPNDSIIVMGRSIGTGPAVCLAAQYEDLAGLILVSPFTSIKNLIQYHVGSLARLIADRFPSKELIPKIRAPTMIIHGQKDTLIPLTHGEELYELSATKKAIVTPTEMSHNTSLFTEASWFAAPMHHFFSFPDFTFRDIKIPVWARSRNFMFSQQRGQSPKEEVTSNSWNRNGPAGSTTSIRETEEKASSQMRATSPVLTCKSIVKASDVTDLSPELVPKSSNVEDVLRNSRSSSLIPESAPTLLRNRYSSAALEAKARH